MQRPALLMLALLAGCAPRQPPPPVPDDEYAELVRLFEVPSATRKGDPIAWVGGTACQTSPRMPNAASGSISSTLAIPRSESVGTPVPMPNACPVTARLGANARVVKYQRHSATAAPEPPR